MAWLLQWNGSEPPGRKKAHMGAIVLRHQCDLFDWYDSTDGVFLAFVKEADEQEAWSVVESRCHVSDRLSSKEVEDDWTMKLAIGFKGFRIVDAHGKKLGSV